MSAYIALSAQRGEEKGRPEATGSRRKSRHKSWHVLCNIHLYCKYCAMEVMRILLMRKKLSTVWMCFAILGNIAYSCLIVFINSIIITTVVIFFINKGRGVSINAEDYLFTPPRPMHILPVANLLTTRLVIMKIISGITRLVIMKIRIGTTKNLQESLGNLSGNLIGICSSKAFLSFKLSVTIFSRVVPSWVTKQIQFGREIFLRN